MFSKPIFPIENETIENQFVSTQHDPDIKITYHDFFVKNVELKKYKIPELKTIARYNKILVGGTKTILIQRIENHFQLSKKAVNIQKIYRGFLTRLSIFMRGFNVLKDRSLCVNQTDFYTLEPLIEIPVNLFYSYTDKNNFVYGFNISSLIFLMKNKTSNIMNPYNREKIETDIITNIIKLYRISKFLFFDISSDPDLPPCPLQIPIKKRSQSRQIVTHEQTQEPGNALPITDIVTYEMVRERIIRMAEIRGKSINQRMNDLFMEIDNLGNYTQIEWFSQLQHRDYIRLYRCLYDIWNYRAQLPNSIKRKICIINDPFYGIFTDRTQYRDVSLEVIKESCIRVFENLIYTGIDDEHRKIGALHALTALTVASFRARQSIPWLYESYIF